MKKNCLLILGAMLSTSLLAQQATNPTPAAPIAMPAAAPAATLTPATAKTNAPAAKAGKKKAAKKKVEKKAAAKKKAPAPELKTVPLVAGPATVVASNVNVRGQARLKSEVVTRITKGQTVTVLEEIVRNNSGPEEPSAWAKIALPPGAHVWINTAFIDAGNQTVKPKKLNLRSGPGENYSVIGLLHSGDAVKTITTKGDWREIEAPTSAYAFMAAQYLKQGPAEAPAPTPAPPEPAPAPTIVAAVPPVAPPPTENPVVPPSTETPAMTNPVTPPSEPVVEEPPPPRIVQREGIVRGMTSIQAPSKFVLVSPENGRDIDYLFTTSKDLDLRRYKGLRIIVTGEEGLDERWGNTPVITIQKIQVLE
jgi:SH3-like domain-containing protein